MERRILTLERPEGLNGLLVDCARRELQSLGCVRSVELLDSAFGRDMTAIELDGVRLSEEVVGVLVRLSDTVADQMEDMGNSGWGEVVPHQAMPEWIQPKSKAAAYMGGGIVFHDGAADISRVDENQHEPGKEGGWEPVEFEFVWTDDWRWLSRKRARYLPPTTLICGFSASPSWKARTSLGTCRTSSRSPSGRRRSASPSAWPPRTCPPS